MKAARRLLPLKMP